MKTSITLKAVVVVAFLLVAHPAAAQYPHPPEDLQAAKDAQQAEADRRSDEAFAKAKPLIDADAKNGKPYIPSAAKPEDLPQADIPAFPGAWGGGMHSFGGRGGKVFVVTSLEDSGPGTFREACEAGGARIVVCNVAGIIRLKDRIRVRAPYITINGATAPGDGVCIAGNTVELETHDVILRHLRFRRGQTDVTDRNDSLGGNPVGNIMIDHVSASWGLDENLSMYRHMFGGQLVSQGAGTRPTHINAQKLPTVNITIQNSISAEALNTYGHAFGSTIGGLNSTFYRDLWACNAGRNPSIGMNGDFTFVNNVLFNWVHRTIDGGDNLSRYNIINNYLKPGPATPTDAPIGHRILKPEAQRGRNADRVFGKAYVNGNVVEGDDAVTSDNWNGGVQLDGAYDAKSILPQVRVDQPFPHAPLQITDAKQAYEYVLAHAGATLPKRDAVDQRIIETVRTGKPVAKKNDDATKPMSNVGFKQEHIDLLLSLIKKGIITDPSQVGGYPDYKGEPYKDSDHDGMPDEWETKYRLNPNDPSDASKDTSGDGYTNIEKFINGLDPTKQPNWKDLKNNVDGATGTDAK